MKLVAVDDVVLYKFGEKSSQALHSVGFQDVIFKSYNGYVSLVFEYACENSRLHMISTHVLFADLGTTQFLKRWMRSVPG